MLTSAGRSRRISESTALGVGSMMSMRRLCVRISKCSRLSLYLCGDRMTQNTFFSVGSGTGPTTVAPARVTVSTILRAELSMTSWSYDFKRMRIFCPAISVTSLSRRTACIWPPHSDLRPPRSGVSHPLRGPTTGVLTQVVRIIGIRQSRGLRFPGVSPPHAGIQRAGSSGVTGVAAPTWVSNARQATGPVCQSPRRPTKSGRGHSAYPLRWRVAPPDPRVCRGSPHAVGPAPCPGALGRLTQPPALGHLPLELLGPLVRGPGVARRQLQRLLGGDTRLQLAGPLELGIHLGPEQQREVGQPQPQQEDDHAREGPVGLVVGAEVGHVEPEAHRGEEP